MSKAEIMETANKLIYALFCCDDEEFTDRIIDAVVSAEIFNADEIEYMRSLENEQR